MTAMGRDALKAKWNQFRKELNFRWNQLSSDEIDSVAGKREKLVVLLQRRYGFAHRRAQYEVDSFVTEFEEKLRRAA